MVPILPSVCARIGVSATDSLLTTTSGVPVGTAEGAELLGHSRQAGHGL